MTSRSTGLPTCHSGPSLVAAGGHMVNAHCSKLLQTTAFLHQIAWGLPEDGYRFTWQLRQTPAPAFPRRRRADPCRWACSMCGCPSPAGVSWWSTPPAQPGQATGRPCTARHHEKSHEPMPEAICYVKSATPASRPIAEPQVAHCIPCNHHVICSGPFLRCLTSGV